jgi:hypothetical protein
MPLYVNFPIHVVIITARRRSVCIQVHALYVQIMPTISRPMPSHLISRIRHKNVSMLNLCSFEWIQMITLLIAVALIGTPFMYVPSAHASYGPFQCHTLNPCFQCTYYNGTTTFTNNNVAGLFKQCTFIFFSLG